MKNRSFIALAAIALAIGGFAMPRATRSADEKTFHGVISDSQCATSVHSYNKSHKEMMEMRRDLKSAAECARFCVRERGGQFVLQSGEKVYHLDKPDQAEPYAGQQVKIVGTLDPQTTTITVHNITPVSSTGHPD